MKEDTLYIVMPAYNEEENIREVVSKWYEKLSLGSEYSRLVVADGGSKDNTVKILKDMLEDYPKLRILQAPGTDHGTKVIMLYEHAYENGADWIFQTDSDGQTEPDEFNKFWNNRDIYDCILGNRKVRGDGFSRKMVENVLRLYVRIYFGVWVPDANAPFRLMKASTVKRYLCVMPWNFFLPNAVLSACFKKYEEKVAFEEVTFKPRQGGKNFMNMKKIFKIGWESLNKFAIVRRNIKTCESGFIKH